MLACGTPEAAHGYWQAKFVAGQVIEEAKIQALEKYRKVMDKDF